MSRVRFINGLLLHGDHFVKGDLYIDGHIISEPSENWDQEIDLKGAILAPGFIDLQINGGFGVDFTSQPSRAPNVAKHLPQYGVTSFLAAIITQPISTYPQIFSQFTYQKESLHAECLGLHCEGPFLNPAFAGAHQSTDMTTPEKYPNLYDSNRIKVVTLAPELPGALDLAEKLSQQGVVVSIGHSNADVHVMEEAWNRGLRLVTHLYNTMPPFHHRKPGIVEAVLTHPWNYTLIADNVHVVKEGLQIAWKCNPKGAILVSDAVAALGEKTRDFLLGGQTATLTNGESRLKGKLAGSVLGLNQIVKIFSKLSGASQAEAIAAATEKPAKLLKLYPKKGSLTPGADADLVILDHDLNLLQCYVRGVLASR